jgi:two-component system chemotaxis response regulator CheB
MTIKVLICDDSALIRALLKNVIDAQPDMTVVGTAPDAHSAREMIKATLPDVLTLDIEMPRMDGLDFLERVMRLRPMPVVMISSQTRAGSESSIRALELGAVEVVAKPIATDAVALGASAQEICDKIRAACKARVRRLASEATAPASTGVPLPAQALSDRLICIGASTGGTEAIREVLTRLPAQCPPVVMVQHMPEMFTGSFANRLNSLSALRVKEAEHGEAVRPGHAYLAPGHSHLSVVRRGGGYQCELSRAEPVNRHRPSVDVLFDSAARHAGDAALGVLLTGMGKDGARGLLAMRQRGAWTLAQDEASCVVYGMPREAALLGAAAEVAPLGEIARRIVTQLGRTGPGGGRPRSVAAERPE